MENQENEKSKKAEFDHYAQTILEALKADVNKGAELTSKIFARHGSEDVTLSKLLEQELTILIGTELSARDMEMFTLGMMFQKGADKMKHLMTMSAIMEGLVKTNGNSQIFEMFKDIMSGSGPKSKKQPFDVNDLLKKVNKTDENPGK